MSSEKTNILEDSAFIERFIEVCGKSQTSDIARLLNVSYQAAKNYLQGRVPEPRVLKVISEKTTYSINWLLTGNGDKFVKTSVNDDTVILSDQMRTLVRQICSEIFSEMLSNQNESAQQKVVLLTSEKIKVEKILDESPIISENNSK